MVDREKVIKGLECCTMECTYEHPFRCKGCPYSQDDAPCEALPVKRDALALLKEQERKTGEWITIWREDDPDTSTSERCSVCERISERPVGEYCKWCGAHMTE